MNVRLNIPAAAVHVNKAISVAISLRTLIDSFIFCVLSFDYKDLMMGSKIFAIVGMLNSKQSLARISY
jgi:hypothetical protein